MELALIFPGSEHDSLALSLYILASSEESPMAMVY